MEFFQWLKEEIDENARAGADDCSEKDPDCERIFELRRITQILKHRRLRGVRHRWIGESCVGAMNAVSMRP